MSTSSSVTPSAESATRQPCASACALCCPVDYEDFQIRRTVGVVVSHGVLNLVDPPHKRRLFEEIFRLLKIGGRAVIPDIVSDEAIPMDPQKDYRTAPRSPRRSHGPLRLHHHPPAALQGNQESRLPRHNLSCQLQRPWCKGGLLVGGALSHQTHPDSPKPCLVRPQ